MNDVYKTRVVLTNDSTGTDLEIEPDTFGLLGE